MTEKKDEYSYGVWRSDDQRLHTISLHPTVSLCLYLTEKENKEEKPVWYANTYPFGLVQGEVIGELKEVKEAALNTLHKTITGILVTIAGVKND